MGLDGVAESRATGEPIEEVKGSEGVEIGGLEEIGKEAGSEGGGKAAERRISMPVGQREDGNKIGSDVRIEDLGI